MLQFADALPMPGELKRLGVTKPELTRMRASRFDLIIAMLEGVPAVDLDDATGLEYVQGTYRDPQHYNLGQTKDYPNSKTFAQRCSNFLGSNPQIGGLMLDTPFENVPMQVSAIQAVSDMIAANPDKIIMPNFGDAATWMGVNAFYRVAAMSMYQMCRWHLIEVAVDLSKPFDEEQWKRVRSAAENAVSVDGKRLVLGIYDPGFSQAQLAYSIAATIQSPKVLWLYKAAMAANYDQLWNPWYDKMGWTV